MNSTNSTKPRVFGVCTDIASRNGEYVLKNGKRQFGAVGWYRIVNPLEKLGYEVSIGIGIRASMESALELKKKGDIWFSKIADNEGIDHIYGAHREVTGSKIVIDLDDDPDHVNETHPDFKGLEEKKDMRIRMVKLADHLVVATEQIKEAVKHLNPYITVIPNAIDPEIWKVHKKKWHDGKIRIGWMSSGSHFADLPIIQPVMDIILKKYPNVEFHFAGMTWDELAGKRVYHHVGRSGYMDFPKFYADLGIDISIAPLKDTQFNRCKSNIKWLEASMLKIPTVASDVEPYRVIQHGKTGFLASNQEQWVKYLSFLIENETKRKEIASNAKKEVLANWTIDKFLPRYEELFRKLDEKKDISVVTAITGNKDSLKPQPEYKGVEYVAFVENDVKDSQWKTRKACDKFVKPVMNAKIHKVLAHKYVDTPYIVWMDGACTLKKDPRELVILMGDKDYAFFKHPGRDCVYDEADTCVQMNKGKLEEIGEQIKEYAKREYPAHNGLNELTCFIRKNNPKTNAIFEQWWAEICRYSNRDQISFPVIFKEKDWAVIPGIVAYTENGVIYSGNDFFDYVAHNHYEE